MRARVSLRDGEPEDRRGAFGVRAGALKAWGRRIPFARWLGQPLAQFCLIGAAIFAVYSLVGRPETAPNEIRIGASELRWLGEVWQGQFGRPATAEELRAAVDAYEVEEMRYREALALGLDRDDTVVRRRLAQKYDFLMGSQAGAADPTEAQLRETFEKAPERFSAPALTSFCQVYFGEGEAGLLRARAAVEELPAGAAGEAGALVAGGARLPFPRCYETAAPVEVARDFGSVFSGLLDKLPASAWQGPVESGYGFHAVLVTGRTPGRPLSFDEARPQVDEVWRAEAARQARETDERTLRKRYRIVVDEAALHAMTGGADR